MAMIQCKECHEKISDKAVSCPKCGAEMTKGKARSALSNIVFLGVILVVLFFAMDAMFSNTKREQANFERAIERSNQAIDRVNQLNGR
jgi:uncharacterized membrane protein YvbJ